MTRFFQNDQCLFCLEEIQPKISWCDLFSQSVETTLCEACTSKLKQISGAGCRICSRPFEGLSPDFRKDDLCFDCFRWEEDPEWKHQLDRNISIFVYNDFIKDMIARFKFRGDYILSKAFAGYIETRLNSFHTHLLVPIPLSEERLYDRGFNQAEALINEAGLSPSNCLSRIHTEKQSKKSRSERIHLPQVFQVLEPDQVASKQIILIDDIYTTGSTLRHAAKQLKAAGAASVLSLTLARG
ncbi:amidophosphoribosyltransferase [Bacillus canaveralius]|uniref:Amidophosphoribosyltransferase n=1 Tax=Bacillus canaveralius TaxID=1403243 RepID=A0A2N5GMK7_9BACI|nr:ComF family protein [Bacillus canaveralius]PLR83153.1 amidophosphoribosyltransferase [Bacillus canaveralius]PLR94071.1 amidophosphoribosyltransferase [Bacillus canaveralius]RSK54128.1 ComF family protein [Bacillus canaveralius]